jgi:hypothetical protein
MLLGGGGCGWAEAGPEPPGLGRLAGRRLEQRMTTARRMGDGGAGKRRSFASSSSAAAAAYQACPRSEGWRRRNLPRTSHPPSARLDKFLPRRLRQINDITGETDSVYKHLCFL